MAALLVSSCTLDHASRDEGTSDHPGDTSHHDDGTSERVRVPAGHVTTSDGQHELTAFALDRTFVTRARFERFVDETGFVTRAEREGDGNVLDLRSGHWTVVAGATFRMPRGPDAEPAPADHPATQLSLDDAHAFCTWAGGRVPSELEWEHAARSATDVQTTYPWGDEPYPDGRARANTWEGAFPSANTLRDGHLFTSPVTAFPPSALGLRDIVGNVWHWTSSPYEPGAPDGEVALRGGSHLCDPDVCHGFRIEARQHAWPRDRYAHVGIRCAYAP
ncbi:MAG: formylglycine-generating enzyme family protein [Sandaracinaceae bacterium]|nr:formylglycine-generating enzyme family protein [Sandaracinaceae bacterium]